VTENSSKVMIFLVVLVLVLSVVFTWKALNQSTGLSIKQPKQSSSDIQGNNELSETSSEGIVAINIQPKEEA
jgi:hypothetical protein